ncbi:MAG: YicC/YloC family endoribonuclease [candidate division WOR-3 bacterium]
MTGCGRAERVLMPWKTRVEVEVKTVNHKFLETSVRLPPQLAGYEHDVRDLTREYLRRGYVQLTVTVDESHREPVLRLNHHVIRDYLALIAELKSKYGLPGTLDVNTVLQFPNVIQVDADRLGSGFWFGVRGVIREAFLDLRRMRVKEGQALARDLRQSVAKIRKAVRAIERRVPRRVAERRRNLLAQMKELGVNVDPRRLAEEVTFISERLDIHEECVRLMSHCAMFNDALKDASGGGKKLDFILQEMLRETDTLSAKARDAYISRQAITIKEEVERLKEQVRNVE